MKKTTTNIPAAVFMQVPLDEGFTTEDVNKMLALLKLSPNEQFSFLEIPGESCIAQGIIREAVMEQNDFVCSAGSAFYKGVQSGCAISNRRQQMAVIPSVVFTP